jgi:hypothetical protein
MTERQVVEVRPDCALSGWIVGVCPVDVVGPTVPKARQSGGRLASYRSPCYGRPAARLQQLMEAAISADPERVSATSVNYGA